jgi:uncharacterized damage-inducible protein DinB
MLISPELLAKHLEYSLWASLQVLEATAKMPEAALEADRGNSFGGILATLQHIYRADRVWGRRMGGEPAAPFAVAGESLTVREMQEMWPSVLNGMAEWVRAQDEAVIEGRLDWINIKGEAKSELRYKILLHVVNHASYHRGQVITMIRQAGGEAVSTDLVYYPGM